MEVAGKQRRRLREIVDAYYDAGGAPLRVNFFGDLSDSEAIADRIFLESRALDAEEIIVELDSVKMWGLPLPKDDIRFTRYSFWQVADASFVREIPIHLVEQQIQKKAMRLEKYREKAAEIDLLLVVDRASNAGRFTVPQKASFQAQGFRRIILLNYPLEVEIIATANGCR
ncbi:hypothetical protein D3C77_509460 [compost metagenome]